MKGDRYKKSGWRGDSQGHALAAKGIKLYSKKKGFVDPMFLATKREQEMSTAKIRTMVMAGQSFNDMVRDNPDVDQEDLRLRAIQAVDMRRGNRTLSMMNKNGVDLSVSMAKASRGMRESMHLTLRDMQARSLLQAPKVRALDMRLKE